MGLRSAALGSVAFRARSGTVGDASPRRWRRPGPLLGSIARVHRSGRADGHVGAIGPAPAARVRCGASAWTRPPSRRSSPRPGRRDLLARAPGPRSSSRVVRVTEAAVQGRVLGPCTRAVTPGRVLQKRSMSAESTSGPIARTWTLHRDHRRSGEPSGRRTSPSFGRVTKPIPLEQSDLVPGRASVTAQAPRRPRCRQARSRALDCSVHSRAHQVHTPSVASSASRTRRYAAAFSGRVLGQRSMSAESKSGPIARAPPSLRDPRRCGQPSTRRTSG